MFAVVMVTLLLTGGAEDLRAAIESYLQARGEAEAGRQLDAIVARFDATATAVLDAVRASDVAPAAQSELQIPYRDQLLLTTLRMPAQHDAGAGPPPVVLDISGGRAADRLALNDAIVVFTRGYTPAEFSDEGRDAFLKVLRVAAHRAHGDAARLWLCGYDWGGHACFDTALHRPGVVCGIVPLCGGPRRIAFRLLDQLRGVTVEAFCGARDDPELVWSLNELTQIAGEHKLSYRLQLDPERGRDLALAGIDRVAGTIAATAPLARTLAATSELIADGVLVESPMLRIDAIDEARVKVAREVSVPAQASEDAKRRAMLKSLEKAVVRLRAKIETKAGVRTLTLTPDGVKAATVLVRAQLALGCERLVVRARGKLCFDGAPTADVRTVLAEARRTGDRLDPVLRTIAVGF